MTARCQASDQSIRKSASIELVYAYSAYGETAVLGPDGGNSLRYTGREDDGSGLFYYRARYYDPVLKRFVSEDPLGISAGYNFYQYTFSSPTNYNDPTGELSPFLITGLVGLAGGGLGSILSQGFMCGFGNINWQSVGVASLTGFAAGAALPFIAPGGIPAVALLGGTANVTQYYASSFTGGSDPTAQGASQALWTGIAGGAIGGVYAGPVFNQNVARLLQPSATQQVLNRNAGVGNFARVTAGNAVSNSPTRGAGCGCP